MVVQGQMSGQLSSNLSSNLSGNLSGMMNNGPPQSLGGPPSMLPPQHGSPSLQGQEWMGQAQMPVNGHAMNMPPPPSGPPHPNMQSNMQDNR